MYNMHPNIPPLRYVFVCIASATISMKTGPYHDKDGYECHVIQDA